MPTHATWNLDDELARDLATRTGGRDLRWLCGLIARTSVWVDPHVARAVPLVFPKTARRRQTRQRVGEVVRGVRLWSNEPAAYAFFAALGSNWNRWAGCNVCHIHPRSAYDPRHFTRLANLVVVPRTLWRFTDWPPVEAVLQRRAFALYGYIGPQGKSPPEAPFYPRRWTTPVAPADLAATLQGLRRLRAKHPQFWKYDRESPPPSAYWSPPPSLGPRARWFLGGATDPVEGVPARRTRQDARDLDAEFWAGRGGGDGAAANFVRLLRRHTYAAPGAVVRAVPNPFPKTRRVRPYGGERPGQTLRGITLATNMAAADALSVSIGRPIHSTRGANVNHAWPDAPARPAHFCHLGGLVLVPLAFSSLVDAPPIRRVLQRWLYERSQYCGPSRRVPRRTAHFPAFWPDTLGLSPEHEALAVAKLRRMRAERPGYYRVKPLRPSDRT